MLKLFFLDLNCMSEMFFSDFRRRFAAMIFYSAGKMCGIGKTGLESDLLDRKIREFQQIQCFFTPHIPQFFHRSDPGFTVILPQKKVFAFAGELCQIIQSDRLSDILQHEVIRFFDKGFFFCMRRKGKYFQHQCDIFICKRDLFPVLRQVIKR